MRSVLLTNVSGSGTGWLPVGTRVYRKSLGQRPCVFHQSQCHTASTTLHGVQLVGTHANVLRIAFPLSGRSPYWVDKGSLKTHACPEPVKVTSYGKRVLANGIKLRGGHHPTSGRTRIQWPMYLGEDGNLGGDTGRRRLCEGKGRNGNHIGANQEAWRISRSPQKLEGTGRLFS